jgi:hypothetical protein
LLPIYPALHFVETLKGGGTTPWVVSVLGASGRPEKYVVKPFRVSQQPHYAPAAGEIFGAVLAAEFELQHPEPALIEFTPGFLSTLAEPQLKQIQGAASHVYYGCRLLEGAFPYSPARAKKTLAQYDAGTIYAFDNLICNVDRRPIKPNLLLFEDDAHVIDHELSCFIPANTFAQLQQGRWEHNYQGHLFYPALRDPKLFAVEEGFRDFTDYLRRLNPAVLLPYLDQLIEHQLPVRDFDGFIRYLYYQKANSQQFATLLKGTLQ